jgi:carboxyl-terminal processing protease
MRWSLAVLLLLAMPPLFLAAQPPLNRPFPIRGTLITDYDERDSRRYAAQLYEIHRKIAEQYVRPISPTVLAFAGLKGLYETAGVPVPTNLQEEVRKASANEEDLLRLFARAREGLGDLDSLRGPKAIRASLRALAGALDPYCAVITGPELEKSNSAAALNRGFGLEFNDNGGAGPLQVKSVAPGGPAQRAGLRPNDLVTHLDGRPVNAAGARLPVDGSVTLTILRSGQTMLRTVTLRSEPFRAETILGAMRRSDNSWDYFLDAANRIALIRVGSLDFDTSDELTQVLADLQSARMRGLILDLRWCPGGYLDESRVVADLFLGDYSLPFYVHPAPFNLVSLADALLDNHRMNARVVYRDILQTDYQLKRARARFAGFPIVVLINGETSGGGELIAAVLQDNMRALVAGQRTRGKASVQKIMDFRPESRDNWTFPIPATGMKLTNGILLRPSGRNMNRFADSERHDDWGVHPDRKHECRISSELNRRLRDWWMLQNLRPGSSNESLPLDDPITDPQRQVALQLLRSMLK